MSEKKLDLRKIEIVVIVVFLLGFLMWAVPKCSSTKSKLNENAEKETIADSVKTDSLKSVSKPDSTINISAAKPDSVQLPAAAKSILYVTINNLKLRTGPSLDSAVVAQLRLFEEVYFMNEVTDFKQELSLGYEVANEPWV
ncbi:MAG TPA: hypothetical protein PKC40_08465, partial [Saprospiraceae bacterium]|nr:hypothetical protein [Saprospiraceae bacterium]